MRNGRKHYSGFYKTKVSETQKSRTLFIMVRKCIINCPNHFKKKLNYRATDSGKLPDQKIFGFKILESYLTKQAVLRHVPEINLTMHFKITEIADVASKN